MATNKHKHHIETKFHKQRNPKEIYDYLSITWSMYRLIGLITRQWQSKQLKSLSFISFPLLYWQTYESCSKPHKFQSAHFNWHMYKPLAFPKSISSLLHNESPYSTKTIWKRSIHSILRSDRKSLDLHQRR